MAPCVGTAARRGRRERPRCASSIRNSPLSTAPSRLPKPITQADLDQARIGVLRSLPEQFETIGAVGDREKIEGQVKDLMYSS